MKSILSIIFVFFYISSFCQSRIDSNAYKRIQYLDYAQITQDIYYSLNIDTIINNKIQTLYIDSIYYLFKFDPYPDELKKKSIKGTFKLYLLNEKNDTIYKRFIQCSDSVFISIPTSKVSEKSKLIIIEKTLFKNKRNSNKSFQIIENEILSLYIDNIIYRINHNKVIIDKSYLPEGNWLKPNYNMNKIQKLYSFPINDLILKTVSGVN